MSTKSKFYVNLQVIDLRKRRQEVGVEERNGDNKRVAICTKEEEEGVERLEEERRGEERTGQVREKKEQKEDER